MLPKIAGIIIYIYKPILGIPIHQTALTETAHWLTAALPYRTLEPPEIWTDDIKWCFEVVFEIKIWIQEANTDFLNNDSG